MLFRDRGDAGRRLAGLLNRYRGRDCVVLALPRGGVPVAAEVAQALDAPLDLLLVRKVGVPRHPELAMGSVIDGGEPIIVRDREIMQAAGVGDTEFDHVCAQELKEIERRRKFYLGGRAPQPLEGRIAIVVDDGLATGNTMRAALQGARQRHPARLVMAVPVAPPETLAAFADMADDIVCIATPDQFGAVGYYYQDFSQTSDAEVIALLAHHAGHAEAMHVRR